MKYFVYLDDIKEVRLFHDDGKYWTVKIDSKEMSINFEEFLKEMIRCILEDGLINK